MKVKVKASFKSVDFDLTIRTLLGNNNGLSGLNGGNGAGNKGLGGLSGGDESGLLTPMGFIKGVDEGVDTSTSSTVGDKRGI